MELLIPGVVFAAALAIIVKAVKFYRRGDLLRALFWIVVLVASIEVVGLFR